MKLVFLKNGNDVIENKSEKMRKTKQKYRKESRRAAVPYKQNLENRIQ